MNDQPQICSKCQNDLTDALAAGNLSCPVCGAAITPPLLEATRGRSAGGKGRALFWLCLIAPAALAAFSFSLGHGNKNLQDLAFVLGFGSVFAGLIGSVYCGCWVAVRFCPPGGKRVLAGLAVILALGLVNLIIGFVGCVSNIKL